MSNISVFDVAKYILEVQGDMSAMKLQKLVYYSQVWSLAWDDEALFPDKTEAWANGPVVRPLYDKHRGQFQVSVQDISPHAKAALNPAQEETINTVLYSYGDKSAQWLSDQTHSEAPWLKARKGLSDADRGEHEITLESMAEYYGSLE